MAEAITAGFNAAENAITNREKLRQSAKEQNARLVQAGYNPDTLEVLPNSAADVERAANQRTMQLANSLQGKLAAQDTDNALVDFAETGDATFLQKALDNNSYIKQAWGARGVQQIGNIDFTNDNNILAKAGFQPSQYDTEEKQNTLRRNIYKVYDGEKWDIGLLNNVVKETGAYNRVGSRRGEVFNRNQEDFRSFMSSAKAVPYTGEGNKYAKEISAASKATGIPPNLLASIIAAESNGDAKAVSKAGAIGLMQLMPDTAKELGVDPNDPQQNIMGGARYLAKMLDRYNGNVPMALAAYNAGPGNVDKYGGIPPFEETQKYVPKVIDNYRNGERFSLPEGQEPDDKYLLDMNARAITGENPQDATINLQGLTNRQTAREDARMSTIRDFLRADANAAKGTTNELADAESKAKTINDIAKAAKADEEPLTTMEKNLLAADKYTKNLVDGFGGEEEFFKTDFSKPENYNKAWSEIVKIGKLEGSTLTQKDRDSITDMRKLVTLSDPASQLTSEQTGLIDNAMGNVGKYLSESGNNAMESKAAMAAFRNTFRHALFGSALTAGEITAFNEAFGTNSQKLGPALRQFKVALSQVSSELDSVASMTNPYTAHVLLGADRKRMDAIRSGLQERINYIEGLESGAIDPNSKVADAGSSTGMSNDALAAIMSGKSK